MSFAIAGYASPGILIKDADCVNKTYPNFFTDLKSVLEAKNAKTTPSLRYFEGSDFYLKKRGELGIAN